MAPKRPATKPPTDPAAEPQRDQVLLLHVSGDDRPGIIARLAGTLEGHNIQVLDINQTVIHRTLLLGLMLRLPATANSRPVLKDLLFVAHELGLRLRMTPVSEQEYEGWVARQGKGRHILTLLSRRITVEQLAQVTRVTTAHGLNIDVITRLTGRPSLRAADDPQRACIEISLRGEPNRPDEMRAQLVRISREMSIDLAWQRDDAYRRSRRLVVFDQDRTLIQQEVLAEMAAEAGVSERDAELAAAVADETLSLEEGLRQRVALLEGLSAAALENVHDRLRLSEGAERLIGHLQKFGYKTALISGGFDFFAERLKDHLGIDYAAANRLEIAGGQLTGRVKGQIVTGKRKADLLKGIASIERISLEQVIAVGDGIHDLPMLAVAGLGIAFHARPTVEQAVEHKISTLGLDGILYLIGIRDRDLIDAKA
jgi:phosphoserine phosphatase